MIKSPIPDNKNNNSTKDLLYHQRQKQKHEEKKLDRRWSDWLTNTRMNHNSISTGHIYKWERLSSILHSRETTQLATVFVSFFYVWFSFVHVRMDGVLSWTSVRKHKKDVPTRTNAIWSIQAWCIVGLTKSKRGKMSFIFTLSKRITEA